MDLERFKIEVLPLKDKLLGYARWSLGDKHEAEDIVQEVLLRLWYMKDKLTVHPNIPGLSMQITKNLCLDYYERKSRSQLQCTQYTTESQDKTPYSQLELKDSLDRVLQIINGLPPLQKTIFRMKHIDGYEVKEIAEITGSSVDAVKMNLSRARKKIKEIYFKTEE